LGQGQQSRDGRRKEEMANFRSIVKGTKQGQGDSNFINPGKGAAKTPNDGKHEGIMARIGHSTIEVLYQEGRQEKRGISGQRQLWRVADALHRTDRKMGENISHDQGQTKGGRDVARSKRRP